MCSIFASTSIVSTWVNAILPRPALERFYQSLSDEQKARFNAIASADDPDAAAKDQRDLTRWCDQNTPGLTDLPIDRIAQAVQPRPEQRAALDELEDASVEAGERLKMGGKPV